MSAVAAIDIGTNSTRLLIVTTGEHVLARESIVTRLGEGVERSGELGEAPQQRVLDVLASYRAAIEEHGVRARRGGHDLRRARRGQRPAVRRARRRDAGL